MKLYIQDCPLCRQSSPPMDLDETKLRRWMDGELIQNVFPELSIEERELMITGMHSDCYDNLFEGQEE